MVLHPPTPIVVLLRMVAPRVRASCAPRDFVPPKDGGQRRVDQALCIVCV